MTSSTERDPLLQSVNSNTYYNTESNNSYRINRDSVTLPRRNSSYILPAVLILILVLLERVAYYSLSGNLYLFLSLQKLHWIDYNALSALFLFTGVSYLASLFGGWLSDAYFGRFKTIGFAFLIFTGAYWTLSCFTLFPNMCYPESESWYNLTCPTCRPSNNNLFSENCSWTVMSILIFAAIGTGVVKANITPFGAEQVRHTGPDGLKIYLNWLYWCVNIGALTAILGITYIQQEKGGFQVGYIIPAGLLTGATLLFWLNYPIYAHQEPSGSSISRTFDVIKEAWKSRYKASNNNLSSRTNQPDWLDLAKVRYGGLFHEAVVEDVKSLSTIIKVFSLLVPYWILYFQMQSSFLAQGLHMRLRTNSSASENDNRFSIPAAWLMLFNVVFLIIFIPFLNHLIYPCLKKRGVEISMLSRMSIGMICAATSMIVAGCLELCRHNYIDEHKTVYQMIENTTYVAADISILWQIPQYSLIGISEVFTSVSGMEFAYSQAPTRMQGAVMGLYYFCAGIGSFLGVAILKVYEKLSDYVIQSPFTNINQANFFYYFFTLAVIQIVAVIIFIWVSKTLKIRKPSSPNRSPSDIFVNSTS